MVLTGNAIRKLQKPKFVPKGVRAQNSEKRGRKTAHDRKVLDLPLPEPKEIQTLIPEWRLSLENKQSQPDKVEVFRSWRQKKADEFSPRDWKIMARDLGIQAPEHSHLLLSFEELGPEWAKNLRKCGYREPTPIQRATIPIALSKTNVIGVAETGSGKTAGFLIPLIKMAVDGALSVVIAPTRELSQQIYNENLLLGSHFGVSSACLVGGYDINEQADALAKLGRLDILVATPGRLIDFLNQGLLALDTCSRLVLDEADRMIDMGFETQLNEIISQLPKQRQTLLFTATWPPQIEELAARVVQNPCRINVGSPGAANQRVKQEIEFVEYPQRNSRLFQLLKPSNFPAIVFVNQKRTCEELQGILQQRTIRCETLQGDKAQAQREAVLASFKSGRTDVLVATDVAGRGIDVPDVALVVNYEMPISVDTYVHRIGRTGRAGRSGRAVTFLHEKDRALFPDLLRLLRASNCRIPEFLYGSV